MGSWIFDDISSFAHLLLGVLARKSPQGTIITGLYLTYQLVEIEPMKNKLGDLVEFGLGYAVGKDI